MTEMLEALIPRVQQLEFSELKILVQYLITDRRRLQLLLDEAITVNEEWRAGVDRQGQQLLQQQIELQRLQAALQKLENIS